MHLFFYTNQKFNIENKRAKFRSIIDKINVALFLYLKIKVEDENNVKIIYTWHIIGSDRT